MKVIVIRCYPDRADSLRGRVKIDFIRRLHNPTITISTTADRAEKLYQRLRCNRHWHIAPSLGHGGIWNAGRED